MAWKGMYKRGNELLKQERYEDAIITFTEGIRDNNKVISLYDSRATIYKKLNQPMDARKDYEKIIELSPSSWKGYAGSARALFQVGDYKSSLVMIDLALERFNTLEGKRRAELDGLRRKVLKAMEQFSRLPIEIQSEIFALVIGKKIKRLLALTHVCRAWRKLIHNMPWLWQYLELMPYASLEMTGAWMQRSRGDITSLYIRKGCSFEAQPSGFWDTLEGMWSSIEAMEVRDKDMDAGVAGLLPPSAWRRLRLQRLKLHIDSDSPVYWKPEFWKPLELIDTSYMQTLSLITTYLAIPLQKLALNTLTSLELVLESIQTKEVLAIVADNPLLEALILDAKLRVVFPVNSPCDGFEPVRLSKLKRFSVYEFKDAYLLLLFLEFPNLEKLVVERIFDRDDSRCCKVLSFLQLPHLRLLKIIKYTIDPTPFIAFLRASSAIERLVMSHCTFRKTENGKAGGETILAALAETAPYTDKHNRTASMMVYCPRLQHLDISWALYLKGGFVIQVVKERKLAEALFSNGAQTMVEENGAMPIPIRSLNIDHCYSLLINPHTVAWLRNNVDNVICGLRS